VTSIQWLPDGRHFLSFRVAGKFYATTDVPANTRSLALSIFGICIFPASGTESCGRREKGPLREGKRGRERERERERERGGERQLALSGVEDCNREGVPRGTFPSLPTVCSFRAATPYLQVQCLLSLIHIPWPTHPYYPWLSTGPRTYPLAKCTCLHCAGSHSRIPFAPFTRARVCVIHAYATGKVVSSRGCFL